MIIRLTKEELSNARQQAKLRNQLTTLTRKFDDKKDKNRTSEDLNIMGAIGEVCFAKIFDKPLILTEGIDDGTDFYLTDLGIDIKATPNTRSGVHLLFETREAFKSSVSVLFQATNDPNMVKCCGWISKKHFLEIAEQWQNGSWAVHEDNLRPIKDLWFIYKSREMKARTIYE